MPRIIPAIILSLFAAAPPGAFARLGSDDENSRSQFAGRKIPSRSIRIARHKGRNLAKLPSRQAANRIRSRDDKDRRAVERQK
jgi:hypothetical protein